ncbi:MAG: hypothetical protein U0354_19870 [Candidatus Sericytochromatia bacterium]
MLKKGSVVLTTLALTLTACGKEQANLMVKEKVEARELSRENPLDKLKVIISDSGFNTKATLPEIANAAVVSLIGADTGITHATGVTTDSGAFRLTDSGTRFVPESNKTYILQASKRTGKASNGDEISSLATFVTWNGVKWLGVVNTDAIILNQKTTSLLVISQHEGKFSDKFFGSMSFNSTVLVNDINDGSNSVSAEKIMGVKSLVDRALEKDIDSISKIKFNNEVYSLEGDTLTFPNSISGKIIS